MMQLIKLAFRNISRNKRRSILSALAVALGLALLLMMASIVRGEMQGALATSIKLSSGDLQVRSSSYVEAKTSLKWSDLVINPDEVAAQIKALPQVLEATPRLFATGIVTVGDTSTGVKLLGLDPLSTASTPYSDGMVSGTFLASDDQSGILIGKGLADKLKVAVGDQLALYANTSNGDVAQQKFTIRGIFSTQTPGIDDTTVLLPLAKAQALTQTTNHASTIFVLLKDRDQSGVVAASINTPGYQVLTWQGMNEVIIQTEQFANAYMFLMYLIVLGVTATVIVNTLVMAVYERTREIGILAAIGMKGRRIMTLFLTEASLLAAGGIVVGLILGVLICLYLEKFGIYIGDIGATGFLVGERIYAELNVNDAFMLTIVALIVTLVASLYPAITAARLEPVEALHGK
ncbi:MAG TPA: ABC transporter permease [Longilinea sp.]|nr:ABC transporter permease [Longilinea sp.]